MCHWVLRIWTCGDSFFTKYSSCSFDRAARDLSSLLNPLHPSVVALKTDDPTIQDELHRSKAGPKAKTGERPKSKFNRKPKTSAITDTRDPTTDQSGGMNGHSLPSVVSPMELLVSRNLPVPTNANEARTVYAQDTNTGKTLSIPLSEVGKASRFGDPTFTESAKCNVFEVVLQSKEQTICPACARSPKRASLPAHARGCFGLS